MTFFWVSVEAKKSGERGCRGMYTMNIAIHTKELENPRVDGTRSYLCHVLHTWVSATLQYDLFLYHGHRAFAKAYDMDSVLSDARVVDCRVGHVPLWTQSRFAFALKRDRPDVLWMPVHNLPRVRPRDMKTVVTIHDLAFKVFPEMFPAGDRRKHDVQTAYVCAHADRIIAVSEATKNDILQYFPHTDPHKISVVHHGVDQAAWADHRADDGSMWESVSQQYGIVKPYIIFVGGLQPRKNLVRLLRAFELVREKGYDLQLVIVGGDAWLSDGIHRAYARSPHAEHVVMTGTISGDVVVLLLRGAAMSAYVPLYEGFGMPILEAFAAQTPVLTGRHSSLQEVAGRAAHFCDVEDVGDIAHGIMRIVDDLSYARALREKGTSRLANFTWRQCADKTLAICAG